MSDFINPIEGQLLKDLLALYACDLRRENHDHDDEQCLVCSKLEIILAIQKYQALNAPFSPEARSVVTVNPGVTWRIVWQKMANYLAKSGSANKKPLPSQSRAPGML